MTANVSLLNAYTSTSTYNEQTYIQYAGNIKSCLMDIRDKMSHHVSILLDCELLIPSTFEQPENYCTRK